MADHPIKLAVPLSGGGTTLQNLIDRIAAGTLNAKIVSVIASRPGIKGIERAEKAGIPVHVVIRKEFASIEAFSERLFSLCEQDGTDLIALGGWLQLLYIPDAWLGRVINIHPSLLPLFGGKGMWGHRVHEAAIEAKSQVSGCTVHFVNNEYDAGPVILQRVCPALPDDTADTLAARVFEEEKIAYPTAIELIRSGKVQLTDGKVIKAM